MSATLPYPTTLIEFSRMFPDEAAAVAYLWKLRYPDEKPCPNGCVGAYTYYQGGRVIHCKACRKNVSLTAGTIMHRSHTPLLVWFYGAYLTTTLTPGISTVQFQAQLGLTRETAFQILHKLRAAMVAPDREPLRDRVEIDETYIGGVRPGAKGGRSTEHKTLVVGAVEVDADRFGFGKPRAGRVRFRVIEDATAATLEAFIKDHVAKRTIVFTDGWGGYNGLRKLGYKHRPEVEGDPARAGKILPVIHREFGNLKTWLQGTHHGRVERQHLQAYLNEFAFRHNRRFWKFSAFQRVLQIGVETKSPTYREIYEADEYGRNVHASGFGGLAMAAERRRARG